jgi:L-asparaginase
MSINEAVNSAADELRELRGGTIGAITVYALGADGAHSVVQVNPVSESEYWIWHDHSTTPSHGTVSRIF